MRTAPCKGRRAEEKQSGLELALLSTPQPVSQGLRRNIKDSLPIATLQILLTAIPEGTFWRCKAVGCGGSVALAPIFANRLEALGACVLLAREHGGRVVP